MKILRQPEVCRLLGKHRTTIDSMEKRGDFPKRIKFGVRAIGWKKEDIDNWLQKEKAKKEK